MGPAPAVARQWPCAAAGLYLSAADRDRLSGLYWRYPDIYLRLVRDLGGFMPCFHSCDSNSAAAWRASVFWAGDCGNALVPSEGGRRISGVVEKAVVEAIVHRFQVPKIPSFPWQAPKG